MDKNKLTKKSEGIIVYGASLGAAFGAAIGTIFESVSIAFGISIGIILGTIISLLFGEKIVEYFGNPDKTDLNE